MSTLIQIGDSLRDNGWWLRLLREYVTLGEPFRARCWQDEAEQAQSLLRFGRLAPSPWRGGVVIEGTVTRELLCFLGAQPKPIRTADGYNRMTPFFTLEFGSTLFSEHYGTEITLIHPPHQTSPAVEAILQALADHATIHRDV